MKTNYFYQILFALFISASALTAQTATSEPVVISGTKFTYPLIEKWIVEYTKENPNAKFKIVAKLAAGQSADLNIIAHKPGANEISANQGIVYAGKYALLPITNVKNPILALTSKKGLSKKEIDKLFFEVLTYDDDAVKEKSKYPSTIYARDNQACASTALAGYFGHVSADIRGKKVLGDDIYLLSAIKKDSLGIAYNNLGYLFDTNSRKLKEGFALLPLDLKKETKDILTGNVDEVISILERSKIESIPVEKFGFIYSQQNTRKEIRDFLKWVLNEGQKFNHEKGFLNLEKDKLAEQSNQLTEKYLSLK